MGTDLAHAEEVAQRSSRGDARGGQQQAAAGAAAAPAWVPLSQTAIDDVCQRAAAARAAGSEVSMRCSFYEIYQVGGYTG